MIGRIHLTRGFTLSTPTTRTWTAEEWAANNAEEEMMLFAFFTPEDRGRGRILVARFSSEKRLVKFKRLWNTMRPKLYATFLRGKRDGKQIRYSALRGIIKAREE